MCNCNFTWTKFFTPLIFLNPYIKIFKWYHSLKLLISKTYFEFMWNLRLYSVLCSHMLHSAHWSFPRAWLLADLVRRIDFFGLFLFDVSFGVRSRHSVEACVDELFSKLKYIYFGHFPCSSRRVRVRKRFEVVESKLGLSNFWASVYHCHLFNNEIPC